jgi:hypothetical protein
MQYNFISKTSDKKFNTALMESLVQQLKFLRRLLYLQLKPLDKVLLVRAVAAAAAAINDRKTAMKAVKELTVFLEENDCLKSCKTSLEILNVLRNIIDIQSIIVFYKQQVPEEISKIAARLADVIRKIRHPDGGISVFQSEFTPSPAYADALLSCVKHENSIDAADADYTRLQSAEGTVFIDLGNKYFPLEFSTNYQRMILGTYLYFSGQKLFFSEGNRISHSVNKEKNNTWFDGKSEFVINDHEIIFEKKLYINNLGTDIRCEESLSTKSFDVTHYMVLPGEIDISLLEYQNGFFMDLKSGARWLWSFNKGAKFTFDFERTGILNGEKRNFTLLAINAGSSDKLRWSLKKV